MTTDGSQGMSFRRTSHSWVWLATCVPGLVLLLGGCFNPDASGQRQGIGGGDVCVTKLGCDDYANAAKDAKIPYTAGVSTVPSDLTPPPGVMACGSLTPVGAGTHVHYVLVGTDADTVLAHYRRQLAAAGYTLTQPNEGCGRNFHFDSGTNHGQFYQWVSANAYDVQYELPWKP